MIAQVNIRNLSTLSTKKCYNFKIKTSAIWSCIFAYICTAASKKYVQSFKDSVAADKDMPDDIVNEIPVNAAQTFFQSHKL